MAKESQNGKDRLNPEQRLLIESAAAGSIDDALAIVPKSTKYWWRHRMNTIWTLCTWAAWSKARSAQITCPSYEAIWGSTGSGLYNYQNTRTGEMLTAREAPKGTWTLVNEVANSARSSSDKVMTGVNLTGLAVNQVLKDEVGARVIRELKEFFPIVGPYAPPIWLEFPEEKIHLVLSGEAHSLRNLQRIIDPEEQRIANLANQVLGSECVEIAVKALDRNAALVPPDSRVQRKMVFEDMICISPYSLPNQDELAHKN